jgi:two-component sensor histidine kinase
MFTKEMEAFRARTSFDMEFEMGHAKTGEVRWHRLIVTPRQLSTGHVWDGLQIDITDHKRAEEHLRLLINELNHRVKNTLATVQSLAAQSFHRLENRGSEGLVNAYSAFEARLFALARGHDVLTRENWESASLSEIVNQAFAPYRGHPEDGSRIDVDGPDLRIPPPMALSLSMALHELCTNPLKYGALGPSGGQVRISWTTAAASTGTRLVIRWEEHGGPPVTPPARKGFGSRLIQDGLARELNGVVGMSYEPAGVVCTIDVPLS